MPRARRRPRAVRVADGGPRVAVVAIPAAQREALVARLPVEMLAAEEDEGAAAAVSASDGVDGVVHRWEHASRGRGARPAAPVEDPRVGRAAAVDAARVDDGGAAQDGDVGVAPPRERARDAVGRPRSDVREDENFADVRNGARARGARGSAGEAPRAAADVEHLVPRNGGTAAAGRAARLARHAEERAAAACDAVAHAERCCPGACAAPPQLGTAALDARQGRPVEVRPNIDFLGEQAKSVVAHVVRQRLGHRCIAQRGRA
mmetsp:Transcript_12813/g.44318  ORF Transcript_12813/g.44318 Transcript_12813/m.44318 type:complete len:262 (-) Transcript_12813:73-858(-)